MTDFPPNSERSREEPVIPEEEQKTIRKVGEATRRKKPLGKRFAGLFFGGDAKTAGSYVVFDVMIPAAKDMLVEAGSSMIERLIFGDSRRRRWSPPPSGPSGYQNYSRYSQQDYTRPGIMQTQQPRQMSRRAREQHNFDEIILSSRGEAEEVIAQLFELISRYESASVSDLYSMVGLDSTYVDAKWGWTDMRGATVAKIRGGGYLLELPEPQPF